MGGGVGVSAHANTRVVTDTSKIAMPEVGIGFIPDVGGAYLLSRAPGALGLHAALTGAPFSGADAIAMGFADHYVPHGELDAFTAAIVDDGIAGRAGRITPSNLHRVNLPHNVIGSTSALPATPSKTSSPRCAAMTPGPAQDAANLIASRSPIAVSVALEAVRRAAKLETLEDVLVQDYRVSSRLGALTRPGGGHPRADHRQRSQSEVVAGDTGRGHRGRRRRVFRAGRRRPEFLRKAVRDDTTTSTYETILVERDERVGIITLNRPRRSTRSTAR